MTSGGRLDIKRLKFPIIRGPKRKNPIQVIKEFLNRSKIETKLLLKGCTCKNCYFQVNSKKDQWCAKNKEEPRKNICYKHHRSGIFPTLIANELVSVQPMAAPNNQIFYIKPIFGNGDKDEQNTPETNT